MDIQGWKEAFWVVLTSEASLDRARALSRGFGHERGYKLGATKEETYIVDDDGLVGENVVELGGHDQWVY